MSQVTIYLEDDTLAAAKEAAKRAHMSVSKWFAQFAEAEKQKKPQSWDAFFAELDAIHKPGDDDFPSIEEIRAVDVPDLPRETW